MFLLPESSKVDTVNLYLIMKSPKINKDSAVVQTLALFYFCFHVVPNAHCITSFEKDVKMSFSQKVILDRFKERVAHRLPQDYMKQDIYLIRWLRAREFNIGEAEQMLEENLRWRKENKMDTILQEDWSIFREMYPYYLDTVNKEGMPILSGHVGDWDLRAAVLAGRSSQLIRYIEGIMEDAATTIRKFQNEGRNVTQFDYIVNMEHYNVVQQGCSQCIPFYVTLINSAESHYPNLANKIWLINTPPVFQVVLRLLRPFMSPITKEVVKVFGQDKTKWQKALFEIADRNQLRPEYGGTFRKDKD